MLTQIYNFLTLEYRQEVKTHDGIVGWIFAHSEIDPTKDRGKVLTPEIDCGKDRGKVLTPKIDQKNRPI